MLILGGEDQKGFLLNWNSTLVWATALQIVDLALSKNESPSFNRSLLKGDPSCHIFDVLDDEIHWNPVVSESWDYDICIDHIGEDEVSEGVLYEFVVLFEDTNDWSPSFYSISLQTTAKSDIVVAVDEYFVCEKISNSFIVESHQTFKENDICWTDISRFFKTSVLNEGILWNFNGSIAFDQIFQSFVCEIEVQSVRMIEVVLSNADLSLIHI